MRINHNNAALNTYRQLTNNEINSQKSLEKLSSGLRINKAGDDAAGLAISEKMRAQIRGLDQAGRNAQDGISLIQTAEGNLSETQSILQRMRELATQAANDTNVTVDRSEIQKEVNQLTSEINRIGNTTEFNTQKLLKGKDVAVVATAQNVATTTPGIAGVPVGATSALAVNAKSVVAIASTASLQGASSSATGSVGITDQTTVSIKGQDSSTVISGLTFTSSTLKSATPNGITVNIIQLANATGTASTITSSGAGSSTIINFNIGTDASGKSLFTGTNRGELANFLTGITGYATSGVTISVPEDPNANGPASAEKLVGMPDSSQTALAATLYSGTLADGVTEQRGVSTFTVTNAFKEAGDTVTVAGKTFKAVDNAAKAANGEFNVQAVNSYIVGGATSVANTALTTAGGDKIDVTVGATTFTVTKADLDAYEATRAAGKTMTNDDLVSLFNNALDASGNKLSTVADVSIGTDNKMQIVAKTAAVGTDVTVNATYGNVSIKTLTGFTAATTVNNDATKKGNIIGADAADQARSLRVALNSNSTVGSQYTATGTAKVGEIAMIENATQASGASLSSVTVAGANANNKLNVTDLAGKNLSTVTVVKGTGVTMAGSKAVSSTVDTGAKWTSGTNSAEFQGAKIAFSGLSAGTAATNIVATWDAANRTMNVTGNVLNGETAAGFQGLLLTELQNKFTAAGFQGGSALTSAVGTAVGGAAIIAAYNGQSVTFGSGAASTNVLDTSLKVDSTAGTGNEFHGVRIGFNVWDSGLNATSLSAAYDANSQTLTVTGGILALETAANINTAIGTAVKTGLISAGFIAADVKALTFTAGGSDGTAAAAALNNKFLTFDNGGGINDVTAHAMDVDQKDGNLIITLSDTTANFNTAAKIQAAVQALGVVKASGGDVDFTKYQFTSEGDWDTKELGEDITKGISTLVGGTREVQGDYSFDITKAFDVGDKVIIKGQTFTAVASGAIGSKNEFDVSGGNIAKQAISLRNAIGLNSVLSQAYNVTGTANTVKMTEITATGKDLKTTDLDVKATGTAGEYSVNVGLLENGAAFVLDGKDIMVSAKNANVGYDKGTAIKVTDDVAAQTAEIADAINKNADLKVKYTASVGSDGSLVIKQNELQESSTAPTVATKNSSIGEFTASLQIGANAGQSMTVDVNDMRSAALSVSGDGSVGTVAAKDGKVASYVTVANVTDGTNNNAVEFALDVSSAPKASAAISVLNDAIESVSSERAKLGAFQNRLEHTISNLGTSSENMTSAESRIRDVDMAKEMMEFTKNNILNQAATAMLAQANQAPQGILQLLR